LIALRWTGTIGNIICFIVAIHEIREFRYGYHDAAHQIDPVPFALLLALSFLNIALIWSPVREFSNYFSLRMRRHALEEQRKIDELEIVELDHPE
jgi:hypothetical protein